MTFQHRLELALDLAFGVSGQFETHCKALHVVLLHFVVAVLVLEDVVLFAHSVPSGILFVRGTLLPRGILHLVAWARFLDLKPRAADLRDLVRCWKNATGALLLVDRLPDQALLRVGLLDGEAAHLAGAENIHLARAR